MINGILSGLGGAAIEGRKQKTLTLAGAMCISTIYALTGMSVGLAIYSYSGADRPELILLGGSAIGAGLIEPAEAKKWMMKKLGMESKHDDDNPKNV